MLPAGCDSFGYLDKARSISEGSFLKDPTKRPFDPQLTDYLKSKYLLREYSHMINPHAYHINKYTLSKINQYPVGLGLLLSIIPIQDRTFFYPPICAFLLIFFILAGFMLASGKITLFDMSLVIIVLGFMRAGPFQYSFSYIFSMTVTYGILIAAGYLFNKKPGISIVLIGLASIFRLSNIMLFVPCLIVYFLQSSDTDGARPSGVLEAVNKSAGKLFTAVFLFLLGYSINFLYTWVLLGSPFRSTYTLSVMQLTRPEQIAKNFNFYIFDRNNWFFTQLVFVWLILLLSFKDMKSLIKWFFVALFILFFNYLLVIYHRTIMWYYPYASAMLLIGILIALFKENFDIERLGPYFRKVPMDAASLIGGAPKNHGIPSRSFFVPAVRICVYLYAIVTILYFYARIDLPRVDRKEWFLSQTRPYRECLSQYDVVWAEFYTGTIEYTTSRSAFRYNWGSSKVRMDIMVWLSSHGYRQAVIAEKRITSAHDLKKELDETGIPYTARTCEGIVKGAAVTVYDLPSTVK